MTLLPTKDTKCSQCIWATLQQDPSTMESEYICRLEPDNPIPMGSDGKHSDREKNRNERES